MNAIELRLECLKIAASDHAGSHHTAIVEAADAYTRFVQEGKGNARPNDIAPIQAAA
jgi:hypothetical protein